MERISSYYVKIIVAVTYVIMVVVNALASIIPINGLDTGQVSDSFPNLFAPAGLTFSIWGLIYLLLLGYTLFQFGLFSDRDTKGRENLFREVGLLFAFSSLANAAWILAWHYYLIGLSMVIMIVILVLLARITIRLDGEKFSLIEKVLVRLPFAIYFGWITVATVANATSLLVFSGWGRFGLPEVFWAVLVILAGAAIGLVTMYRFRSMAYGFVIVWAYLGILIKHTSPANFAGQYPAVVAVTIACLAILIFAEGYLFYGTRYPEPRGQVQR